MTPPTRSQTVWLVGGAVLVAVLAGAVFTLGSLNTSLQPGGGATIGFVAVSTFIAIAFFVFGLILARNLVRLWTERRASQLGSRFKTKMVAGAMGISLLPIIFLFLVSYALVNRTLTLWFSRPLETAEEERTALVDELVHAQYAQLKESAKTEAAALDKSGPSRTERLERSDRFSVWIQEKAGPPGGAPGSLTGPGGARLPAPPAYVETLADGAEIWVYQGSPFLAARTPLRQGAVLLARPLPQDFLARTSKAQAEIRSYSEQRQNVRRYKQQILLALFFITLLLIFAVTWVALFLSKQVTIPIQALAEATQEIAHGNMAHRVQVEAQDELGTLISSFNQMTAQLEEGRRQISEFNRSLQLAIEERERRRKLLEAVLENIPTGVLSLDTEGGITRVNSAVTRIFGDSAGAAQTLADLLGESAALPVQQLMRRSLRMGVASQEMEFASGGRLIRAAVTVSSLSPRRSNPGFVVVLDDLTELLRAQKAAAWQEVAQRIAHEIKNPLTPIQLSAQRMLRHLERSQGGQPAAARTDFERLSAECASLIEREVHTLESLVSEFSEFARFPSARMSPADVNFIVREALEVFRNRLDGIDLRVELSPSLPPVRADAELLRRVLVNLIDNAAEAMESSSLRRISVSTRAETEQGALQIEVADTGHGISPEDKEKLFLPRFSTKDRGTGLGLAIASRIIAEHNGTIQVLDNLPAGARFLIRLPASESPASTPATDHAGSAA